jgi:phosphoribosyl-AMP cyclohydrolase
MELLNSVKFDEKGLVTAVAQDFSSGEVLMVAHMSRETLAETLAKGVMVYFSRSRRTRWMKGETKVDQTVAACHENYFSCFFRKNIGGSWKTVRERINTPHA